MRRVRLRRTAPLVATVLAAGLTATACGSDGSDRATGTPAPAQSSASSTPSAPATPPGGSGGGGIAASANCTTDGLSFAVAPGSGAQSVGSPGAVVINLTNKGTAPCAMNGYPGVDLVGAPTGTLTDGKWSLGRQTSAQPRSVTLRPRATATFTITYLPYTAEGNSPDSELKVTKMVITPPNETRSTTLAWDFQPVLLQDGATHPGTYVGPVDLRSRNGGSVAAVPSRKKPTAGKAKPASGTSKSRPRKSH
ncbi:DUF4232 domain-containing protein [Streptomyces sp. NPDC004111]|uniref:DUF4232 domain-containing protein n=1 Tax=Streptomyces sp. NPDC004111 TaxID=3364690 RepID=UPI00368EF290